LSEACRIVDNQPAQFIELLDEFGRGVVEIVQVNLLIGEQVAALAGLCPLAFSKISDSAFWTRSVWATCAASVADCSTSQVIMPAITMSRIKAMPSSRPCRVRSGIPLNDAIK